MLLAQLKGNSGDLIEGPLLIKPDVKRDERGYFYESWNQKRFNSKTNFLFLAREQLEDYIIR